MTTKRKAELQRKLSLRSVPRPPDDLLDRIKADIPHYLKVEAEREKFSRSVGFHLKIAASVLLVVTSLMGVLFLSSPNGELSKSVSAPMAVRDEAPVMVAPPRTGSAAVDTVQVEIAEVPAPAQQQRQAQVQPSAAVPPPQIADAGTISTFAEAAAPRRSSDLAFRDTGAGMATNATIEGSVVGGTAGGMIGTESMAAAPPPAVATAPAATAPAPATMRERITVTAEAPQLLVTHAYAAELELAPKSVFGLSIDPEVFRRIKNTIEHGGRVAPASVNVEALVNYFASTPERRVRRGVRMEAEGSPAPVESEGHRGILRVTIDTASLNVPSGASVPPIAKDARLVIEFNSHAVREYQPIGDNFADTPESVLLHNLSVTGLYALDLKAPLKARDVVATIRLNYRDVGDNKKHSIVRVLHGSDFAKQWTSSTRRHRLASLGALWGESLRGTQGGTDVARRAEELASDEPDSERARELAAVATASSGGSR